jgi:uncharacterized protein YndB with AHSA1/START domain
MTTVERVIEASPEQVFAVLADGWTYPLWVVGASHMREVDPAWPAVGSRLHHSVGVWPVLLEDDTEVLAMEPDRELVLSARAWPTGTAHVRIVLEPHPKGTAVHMTEVAESGPARLIPRPAQTALLIPRNRESLARLDAVARNRKR